jgi:hypothetical protein
VQVVHASLRVHLGFVRAGDVGELGALENVEIVVGGVTASVSFGADGGSCGEESELKVLKDMNHRGDTNRKRSSTR